MGCASSSTTAQDTTQPNTKPDEETENGNGGPTADSETIPEQSQAEGSPQTADTATDETITPDAAGTVEAANDQAEVPQTDPSATAEGHEEPAPSENTTEDKTDSPTPENTPENTTEDSSPPEEAPASTEES